MNIVAVAACTSGIAHTYIAKEKLIRAAEGMGHTIHVETQGTIGTEGKKTVKVPTNVCVKAPKQLIQKIEAELNK